MKLYQNPFSPNCSMVRMVANQLGLPLELQMVDLRAEEQKKPEYLKLNPNGKVPTLTDGSYSIWETCSIMQYLASKKPSDLWPADEGKRIEIGKWMFWSMNHFIPAMRPYIFETLFKKMRGMGEPDMEIIKKAGDEFHRFAKILDDALAGQPYLVGGKLTLADITAAAYILVYAKKVGVPVEGYKNINRWADYIAQMQAWKSATTETTEMLQKVA